MLDFSPTHTIAESEYDLNTITFLHFSLLKTYPITADDKTRTIVLNTKTALIWLKLFRSMTEDGTYFYMEAKCTKLVQCVDEDVTCSMYANREIYIVLANFSLDKKYTVLQAPCVDVTPGAANAPLPAAFDLNGQEIKLIKLQNPE